MNKMATQTFCLIAIPQLEAAGQITLYCSIIGGPSPLEAFSHEKTNVTFTLPAMAIVSVKR